MSSPERFQRATRAWHDAGVPVADADSARDARAIEALRGAIRRVPERGARRRVQRTLVALAVAAAAALAIGAALRLRSSGAPTALEPTLQAESAAALVLRHGTTRFADPSSQTRIEPGDEVSVASGNHAHLRLGSGAMVEIAAATRLRMGGRDRDEVITLLRGSVSLRVPKLAAPHTLSVVAPDASVIVHGTRFSVTVDGPPSAATRTSVHVTQGEVAVLFQTGHVILRAGQSWQSAEQSVSEDKPPASALDAGPRTDAVRSAALEVQKTASANRGAKSKGGDDLAVQNRLYSSALAARDHGDDDEAVALLTELLDRYPNSPLADEARRVRTRAATQSHGSQ